VTIIENEPQPGAVHHDLAAAIRGHAAITEAIREHAEAHAAAIDRARQEVARAELERRAAGAGTD
jgi:hypothetical protein